MNKQKQFLYAGAVLLAFGAMLLFPFASGSGGGTTSTVYYSVTSATTSVTASSVITSTSSGTIVTTTTTQSGGLASIAVHLQLCQSGSCSPYPSTVYLVQGSAICGATSNAILSAQVGTNGYILIQATPNTAYTIMAAGGGYLSTQCQTVSTGAAGSSTSVTITFTSTGFSVISLGGVASTGEGLFGIVLMAMGAALIYRSKKK